MAKLQILAGTTSKLIDVFAQDSSVATGAGLTGLAFNTASLTAYYYREGAASAVAITLATMTLGTWATGGFIVVDGTNLPGAYQLGIPNAAIAAGAKSVLVMLKGATNLAPVVLEIELLAVDNQDAVRGGMTALPNAAANATGGLDAAVIFGGTASAGAATSLTLAGASAVDNFYNHMIVRIVSGTGAGQERVIVAYVGSTKVATVGRNWTTTPDNTSVFVVLGPESMPSWNLFQGLASAGGATSVTLVGGSATSSIYNGALAVIVAGTGARQARVITAYNGGTLVATVDRAWQTNPDSTSVILILAADLPGADGAGNLSGSVASVVGAVGSVTGAVGSVTGNVGGNVVGTVASVVGNVGGNVVGSVGSVVGAVGSVTGAVGSVTGNVGGNVTGSVGSVLAAVAITAGSVQAIWDALTSALTTVGSVGKRIADFLTGDAFVRLGAPAGASVSADVAAVKVDTAAALTRLPAALVSGRIDASVGAMAANVVTAAAVATDAIDADALAANAVTEIQAGLATSAALVTAQADLDDIQTRLPAALVSGRIDASVGAMAAGTVTAAAVATDAIDADALSADAVTEIQSGLATSSALATVGTNVTTLLSRLGAWTGTGINTVLGALRAMSNKAAVGTPTDLSAGGTFDNTTDSLEGIKDTAVLTPPTAVEIADAFLDRDMSLGTDSGSNTVRTPRQALRFLRNKRSIAGLVMTITKENDASPSWGAAITTSPTAELVTSVDPDA